MVEYQGYTGNEGASRTTWYHRFMLALFPIQFEELDFLLLFSLEEGITKALKSFNPKSEKCLTDLRKVIKRIGETTKKSSLYESDVNRLLKVLVEVKDLDLVKAFIDAVIRLEIRIEDISNNLAKVIAAFKWKNVKDCLYKHMFPTSSKNFIDNCCIINVSIFMI